MKVLDLSHLLSSYQGQWVAMTPDRRQVVANGKDFAECLETALRKGFVAKDLLFSRVFGKDEVFVGGL